MAASLPITSNLRMRSDDQLTDNILYAETRMQDDSGRCLCLLLEGVVGGCVEVGSMEMVPRFDARKLAGPQADETTSDIKAPSLSRPPTGCVPHG